MSDQMNLAGKEVPDEDIPAARGTMLYCPHCEDTIFRSERYSHEHDVLTPDELPDGIGGDDDEAEDDDDDEPERAGAWYAITLSYTMDYQFLIPAWNAHHAKDEAELRVEYPRNCSDGHQVHHRIDEGDTIMSDDDILPDDFDVYGSESVLGAIERQRDAQEGADGE